MDKIKIIKKEQKPSQVEALKSDYKETSSLNAGKDSVFKITKRNFT